MRPDRIEVSRGFLLLTAWLFYCDRSGLVWQGLLACALHELGHLAVLYRFGVPVYRIRVTVFGARIDLSGGLSYTQELAAAAGGPAVNLLLAYACCPFPVLHLFSGVNLTLAVFNLLPAGELDGGRILNSLLHLMCPDRTAERMCAGAELVCCLIFTLCGLTAAVTAGNVTLCLVCLWLLCRPDMKKRFDFLKKERNGSCHGIGKQVK